MESTNKTVVSVLILLAIVLGAGIYFKYNPISTGQPAVETNSNNTNTTTPTTSTVQNTTPSTNYPTLTADEKALFNTPGPTATKAELDAFSTLVAKYAVAGTSVTIKDCTASPEVLKIKLGSKFTVDNKGTTDIHFGFNTDRTLVSAGTSTVITANFKNGAGIYGYGCDDQKLNRAIGILLVTP